MSALKYMTIFVLSFKTIGCKLDILNNEKQTPFDLAAKSPECGRLLMPHTSNYHVLLCHDDVIYIHYSCS